MSFCATFLIGLHLVTYHSHKAGVVLESETPGIYATCDEYTFGAIRNSVEKPLIYGVRTWPVQNWFDVSLGLSYGTYPNPGKLRVRPMGMISKSFDGWRVSLIPPAPKNAVAIHLSREF